MSKNRVKLDFSLNSATERKKYIDKFLEDNRDVQFNKEELELMANYMLYGKNEEGTSPVDRKEISINTKYNSYKKKEPDSLEALLENKTFNESSVNNINHYKIVKPSIDREKDADIPGIKDLWETIDYLQKVIDVSTGKEEDSSIKPLSGLNLYKLKHMLIDIRRQQYYLKDGYKPTICMCGVIAHKPSPQIDEDILWSDSEYEILPLGVLVSNDIKFINPREFKGEYTPKENAKFYLDFRNKEHIYALITHYEDLAISTVDKPESTVAAILNTLDFYIDKANLSEQHKLIIRLKKRRYSNELIRDIINKKYNRNHTSNYISTIFKQQICGKIGETAELHKEYFDNRYNPNAWKTCTCCGKTKLRNTREFVKKARAADGLSNRCKECDKELRRLKKEE